MGIRAAPCGMSALSSATPDRSPPALAGSTQTGGRDLLKVINALWHLLGKEKGWAEIEQALGYFRRNRRRMNDHHIAKAGYPIGSGVVEAANKVLVTQRMKRSGQRWGRQGGQGVLAFRALLKSDRFDRAWSMLVPLMSRSQQDCKSTNQTANDNREPSIAA